MAKKLTKTERIEVKTSKGMSYVEAEIGVAREDLRAVKTKRAKEIRYERMKIFEKLVEEDFDTVTTVAGIVSENSAHVADLDGLREELRKRAEKAAAKKSEAESESAKDNSENEATPGDVSQNGNGASMSQPQAGDGQPGYI